MVFEDKKNWEKLHEISDADVLPAKPIHVALYLTCLVQHNSSSGPINQAYSLHSLRSGGATAACNFGVPGRLFKRHGKWRSENAKDGNIKDAFNDLFVSKNLVI